MKLRAFGRKVIVKPDPDEFVSHSPEITRILKEGKIIIPDAYQGALKKVSCTGIIISLGSECRYGLKEGDRVLYGRFSYERVGEELDSLRIVWEEDVHGLIYAD